MYLSHNHLITNTLQNLLFCIPKAALLHGKSVGFASQKSRFRGSSHNCVGLFTLSHKIDSHFISL
ncbi:hypothetical protein [Prevotella intermedia]|uniref:hypothetical protein n=1 Tax=Prevotella intermedia TaxID=28131 RepID=UPI00211BDA5D|nr:hypothetical protein [Prevotella intermedia]